MANLQNPGQMIQTKTKYHHHYPIPNIPTSLKYTHLTLKIPSPKLIVSGDSENKQFELQQNDSTNKNTSVGKMQRRRFINGNIALITAFSVFLPVNPCFSSIPDDDTFVINTLSSYNIVIFSKSYCPYCQRAKDVFEELRQVPHVVELDERDDGESIQDAIRKIVGRQTVPQVFIGGKHIGGSDETVEAYQNGELAKLLGIESSNL